MGRPTKQIDFKLLEELCKIQCTAEEIASVLGVSVDTIDRRLKEQEYQGFADYYKKFSDQGKKSLRRKQMEVALGGNVSMLIWLGKQLLGQSDKQEVRQETEMNITAKTQAELVDEAMKALHAKRNKDQLQQTLQ